MYSLGILVMIRRTCSRSFIFIHNLCLLVFCLYSVSSLLENLLSFGYACYTVLLSFGFGGYMLSGRVCEFFWPFEKWAQDLEGCERVIRYFFGV
ncbi:hypothetical protein L2E82_36037 [Cichorium intybus]|uniref:Uncharacterized protein n=1 Tax=Cichorium intybus TaxID=13427 RepID=A0ACB9BQF4_CICIN|nr:hypothetical protein L2E82_36037 [Cichorium intybus]